MSIGYVNICSSVHDHRQKFSVFNSSIGSGRTNESNGIYKKEAWVARKRLKKRGSENKRFWRSSEVDIIRSTLHISSSPEAGGLEASKFVQMLLSRLSLQKKYKPEATANSEEFEVIECLFYVRKGQ